MADVTDRVASDISFALLGTIPITVWILDHVKGNFKSGAMPMSDSIISIR